MDSVKTTRLIKKQDRGYEIEIPEEFVKKLDWRKGYVLSIDIQGSKLVIEKLQGFMGK